MRERRFSCAGRARRRARAAWRSLLALLAGGCPRVPAAAGHGLRPVRSSSRTASPSACRTRPPGALAAADNYLALASQSVEQDPAGVRRRSWRRHTRPRCAAARSPRPEQLRAGDTQNMTNYQRGRSRDRGHRGSSSGQLHAAGRDRHELARRVRVGPATSPRARAGTSSTRRFAGRRAAGWCCASDTDPTPAPVPSIVYVDGPNDRCAGVRRVSPA